MLTRPGMRASDVDREAAVALLKDHHAEGRLTLDEFDERIGAAYAAVTLGELARLISDLPPPIRLEYDVALLRGQPVPAIPPPAPSPPRPADPAPWPAEAFRPPARSRPRREPVNGRAILHGLWTALFAVTGVNTAIWFLVLITHGPVYFWPIWVFGPAGAVLGAAELCVRRHGEGEH
jgi:hypothetical protein